MNIIKSLEKQIAELEAIKAQYLAEHPPVAEVKPWPQMGDKVWCMYNYGGEDAVHYENHAFGSEDDDSLLLAIGYLYPTEEAARRSANAGMTQQELRSMPGRVAFNRESAFGLFVDEGDNSVLVASAKNSHVSAGDAIAGVWFKDREAVQKAREKIGDARLLEWFSDYTQSPLDTGTDE